MEIDNLNEIISGLGGAGGTAAILIYVLRRMLSANDQRNKEQAAKIKEASDKIDELTKTIAKMEIRFSVLNVHVENLLKVVGHFEGSHAHSKDHD